jgi:glutathione S-transferase
MTATGIILHQYDISPFSEKVRVILGIKNLEWSSVIQPVIMPKPELIPLTGGYRKIPVMQIGADVYCDSAIIIRELERRFPSPSIYAGADKGISHAIEFWADHPLFTIACDVIFSGGTAPVRSNPFMEDREKLFERKFDLEAMAANQPLRMEQHLGWIESQLEDGRAFLFGDKPGLTDASAFYNIAFIRWANPKLMDTFPALPKLYAWEARVKAIGHGKRSEMTPAEALNIAEGATSTEKPSTDPLEPNGLKSGDAVTVSADDYGRDPVDGTLVSTSAQHVAISRRDPRVGEVTLHFPRAGFHVKKC